MITETDGFAIFNDKEKQKLIRRLAKTKGLLILTDSDSAGFKIRSFIGGIVPPEEVKHAYIPDIFGKERRKAKSGKEGKLGVEGMNPEIILDALRKAGATMDGETAGEGGITKQDLMELGLSGGKDSSAKRAALMKKLELPEHMSANALLQALNLLLSLDELTDIVTTLETDNG